MPESPNRKHATRKPLRQHLHLHLTYANVMVTVLAFIVLGGTAWALAKNSVGTAQLKNGAVTDKKLASSVQGKFDKLGKNLNDVSKGAPVPFGVKRTAGVLDSEANAPKITLSKQGPFTVFFRCWSADNQTTKFQAYIETDQAGGLLYGAPSGNQSGHGSIDGYFDPGETPTVTAEATTSSVGVATTSTAGGVTAIHGDRSYGFSVTGFAKNIDAVAGPANYNGTGRRCVATGYVVKLS